MRGLIFFLCAVILAGPAHANMTEYPKVRLRSIDKITARTMTFDANVGATLKFGSIFIKILSCQKPDIQDRPEAASFLQIWEITANDESKWIFSGWMFASSPALSAMDHPIYDVWVMDCLDDGTVAKAKAEKQAEKNAKEQTPVASPAPTIDNAPPTNLDQIIQNTIGEKTPATPPTVPVE
jgi:hypothetical protein